MASANLCARRFRCPPGDGLVGPPGKWDPADRSRGAHAELRVPATGSKKNCQVGPWREKAGGRVARAGLGTAAVWAGRGAARLGWLVPGAASSGPYRARIDRWWLSQTAPSGRGFRTRSDGRVCGSPSQRPAQRPVADPSGVRGRAEAGASPGARGRGSDLQRRHPRSPQRLPVAPRAWPARPDDAAAC